jgi:DNA topoisomerase VI subunit B
MPIEVRSAHSADPSVAPTTVTRCVLDIDIHRNEPKVEVHEKLPNPQGWRGAEISVTVGGNWTTYRGKVLAYFQQLAVITPYASLKLKFAAADDAGCGGASAAEKRSLEARARACDGGPFFL